jgi:hypothetical protein
VSSGDWTQMGPNKNVTYEPPAGKRCAWGANTIRHVVG